MALNKFKVVDKPKIESKDNSFIQPGFIFPFFRQTTPTGWLQCSGQSVNVSTYPNLANAISPSLGAISFASDGTRIVASLSPSAPHNLVTGDRIFINTSGTLPSGLTNNSMYYAYVWTSTTFSFCPTSIFPALISNVIPLTGTGSGTISLWLSPHGKTSSSTFNVPNLSSKLMSSQQNGELRQQDGLHSHFVAPTAGGIVNGTSFMTTSLSTSNHSHTTTVDSWGSSGDSNHGHYAETAVGATGSGPTNVANKTGNARVDSASSGHTHGVAIYTNAAAANSSHNHGNNNANRPVGAISSSHTHDHPFSISSVLSSVASPVFREASSEIISATSVGGVTNLDPDGNPIYVPQPAGSTGFSFDATIYPVPPSTTAKYFIKV
jgi:hypothetical protein